MPSYKAHEHCHPSTLAGLARPCGASCEGLEKCPSQCPQRKAPLGWPAALLTGSCSQGTVYTQTALRGRTALAWSTKALGMELLSGFIHQVSPVYGSSAKCPMRASYHRYLSRWLNADSSASSIHRNTARTEHPRKGGQKCWDWFKERQSLQTIYCCLKSIDLFVWGYSLWSFPWRRWGSVVPAPNGVEANPWFTISFWKNLEQVLPLWATISCSVKQGW